MTQTQETITADLLEQAKARRENRPHATRHTPARPLGSSTKTLLPVITITGISEVNEINGLRRKPVFLRENYRV